MKFEIEVKAKVVKDLRRFLQENDVEELEEDEAVIRELFYVMGGLHQSPLDYRFDVKVVKKKEEK